MATAEDIAELRRLTDEPTQVTYTDEVLNVRLDAADSMKLLAASIWREKASTLAGLADVREGNSSRNLSQLYKQALDVANSFTAEVNAETGGGRRPSRTRPIERP